MKYIFVCVLLSVVVIRIECNPSEGESKKISPEIICRQGFIIGECVGDSVYWSYDSSKRKCRESCGNNANRFPTKEKCELTCKGIFDAKEANDSEEIRIKAFERVNDPSAREPDLLIEN